MSENTPQSWWRHQIEAFSALLAICAGNSPVAGEFPAQRPVTRSFDVFFDMRLYKRLSKQSRGWWFETLSRPLWRRCNGNVRYDRINFVQDTPSRHPIARPSERVIRSLCEFHIWSMFNLCHNCAACNMLGYRIVFITMTSYWARLRLKSPASRLFTRAFIQVQIKENIKVPRHWPLWGEFTGDRWIPLTKSQ